MWLFGLGAATLMATMMAMPTTQAAADNQAVATSEAQAATTTTANDVPSATTTDTEAVAVQTPTVKRQATEKAEAATKVTVDVKDTAGKTLQDSKDFTIDSDDAAGVKTVAVNPAGYSDDARLNQIAEIATTSADGKTVRYWKMDKATHTIHLSTVEDGVEIEKSETSDPTYTYLGQALLHALNLSVTDGQTGTIPAVEASAYAKYFAQITITYFAKAQLSVVYVDDVTGKRLGDPIVIDGYEGDALIHNVKVPMGYVRADDQLANVPVTLVAGHGNQMTIHLGHHFSKSIKTTKRTVNYMINGRVSFTNVQTVQWQIMTDDVTGAKVATPSGHYGAVLTPAKAGYTVDQSTVVALKASVQAGMPENAPSVTVTYTPVKTSLPVAPENPGTTGVQRPVLPVTPVRPVQPTKPVQPVMPVVKPTSVRLTTTTQPVAKVVASTSTAQPVAVAAKSVNVAIAPTHLTPIAGVQTADEAKAHTDLFHNVMQQSNTRQTKPSSNDGNNQALVVAGLAAASLAAVGASVGWMKLKP